MWWYDDWCDRPIVGRKYGCRIIRTNTTGHERRHGNDGLWSSRTRIIMCRRSIVVVTRMTTRMATMIRTGTSCTTTFVGHIRFFFRQGP